MKLSTFTAKLTGMNRKAKVLAVTVLAGAAFMISVPAVQAQRVVLGVRIGGPRYVVPTPPVVYVAPGYYTGAGAYYYGDRDVRRDDDWNARQAWTVREDRNHARSYDRNDRGRDHDRR